MVKSFILVFPSESCIEWLKKQSNDIGLEFNILEFPPPCEFVVWLTWPGKTPALSSILLNSHIDVVPVDEVYTTISHSAKAFLRLLGLICANHFYIKMSTVKVVS